MILTRAQQSVFERAVAAANNAEPKLQMLEALAAHSPALAERIRDLRAKQDFLRKVAETATQFNSLTDRV
jgi:hypothetical protein